MDTMRGAAIDACARLGVHTRSTTCIAGRPLPGSACQPSPRALSTHTVAVRNQRSVFCQTSTSGIQQTVQTPPTTIPPKAVLFDMDGVLVNSEDLSRKCVELLCT